MKKKYLVGSILVMLLMLVSTQLVFMKTVKSDPTIHYGDAYVGEFWISELDVSKEIEEFDYIGIAHTRADHDWVAWDEGSGNISANWTVDIDSRSHPAYYIIYSLVVYNINNRSQEFGNATFSQSFDKDETYDESGTLVIPIQFSESEMGDWEYVTVVCSLGAIVQLNETKDAKNFSSIAEDHSVVAVDFEMPMWIPLFSYYTNEANEEAPIMWSWIDGWEEKFESETEMLNEQTFFTVGNEQSSNSQNNNSWHVGNISVRVKYFGLITEDEDFNIGDPIVNWSESGGYIRGEAWYGYSITYPHPFVYGIRLRMFLKATELSPPEGIALGLKYWDFNDNHNGKVSAFVECPEDAAGNNSYINVDGYIWAARINTLCYHLNNYVNYQIHIDQNVNQSYNIDSETYYWEDECAYLNETSETLAVSSETYFGITTVEADISNVLQESNQSIYSFAADRGDTRVEFTCE